MSLKYVIGIDESGCGALVGPLVVCAVAFAVDQPQVTVPWRGVRGEQLLRAGDSKVFKDADKRAALEAAVRAEARACAVIERTSAEIDARLFGVVFPEAIHLAALRCLESLKVVDPALVAAHVVVRIDGDLARPALPCAVECLPGGDKLDWRIGAASLVARALCDRRLDALHAEYPRWGFDRSRGYPTREHKQLLAERGPTQAHRRSFRPVRELLPQPRGIEA